MFLKAASTLVVSRKQYSKRAAKHNNSCFPFVCECNTHPIFFGLKLWLRNKNAQIVENEIIRLLDNTPIMDQFTRNCRQLIYAVNQRAMTLGRQFYHASREKKRCLKGASSVLHHFERVITPKS